MQTKKIIMLASFAALFVLLVVIVSSTIVNYNRLVEMSVTVEANEAEIKNRLQQRHDKMEQIISAVEGLQDHAEDIYQMITDARTAYAAATTQEEYIEADAAEAEALSSLLVVVEQNPSITATSAYYAYIDEVSAMENALAVARRDYNESVADYNATVRKFPKNIYANIFGFDKQLDYWKLADGAEEVPVVDFTD